MHYEYGNSKRIYKINDKGIESSSQERELGILIQENLDWDVRVAKVTNQAKPHPRNDKKKLRE